MLLKVRLIINGLHMTKVCGRVYQLAKGGWRFGGEILTSGTENTKYNEFASPEKYDTKESAETAMISYCAINGYQLIEHKQESSLPTEKNLKSSKGAP